jgi:hypothetical protein
LERLKPRKKISQDWLQLDEGDPGFQLLTEKEIAAVIYFLFICIGTTYSIKFSFIYLFSKRILLSFRAIFASLIRSNEDFTVFKYLSEDISIFRESALYGAADGPGVITSHQERDALQWNAVPSDPVSGGTLSEDRGTGEEMDEP